MKTDLLLHANTLAAIEAYLKSPAHSVLLTGNTGNGKTLLARQLAAELLGVSVEKLERHPYVTIIEPQEGKIAIESVRMLRSSVQLAVPGTQTIARVLCLFDADAMAREAQNALLKLLEEPPERTAVILTSSQPRRLLSTIRSRVQTLRVQLPDEASIVDAFRKRGFDRATIEKALVAANGSLAMLETALEKPTGVETTVDLVKQVLGAEPFTRLALIDTELKDKSTARSFVDTLVIVASASAHATKQIARWQRTLEAAATAQKALARNANQKLVLTELMLTL